MKDILSDAGISDSEIERVCSSLKHQTEWRNHLDPMQHLCREAWFLILELRRKVQRPNNLDKVIIP